MGYTTQEFTSCALSNLYPAYYKEFQILNWTHVDLVVTEADGNQILLPRSGDILEADACAVIEYRSHNGMRCDENSGVRRDLALNSLRTRIPFDRFRNAPLRVEEHNFILSTADQSMIAKDMMCEQMLAPALYENRSDTEMTDPRFIFQIVDPYNQWDALLVNVFGQTVVLRAGVFGQFIPSDKPADSVPDKGKLICYLRYPTDYCGVTKSLQTIFEIPLNDLERKEPYQLPSGDVVCIATSMEDLQEIMLKKSSSMNNIHVGIIPDKMVSKETYEAARKNFDAECIRLREEFKVKLETTVLTKNNEIAKLKAENQKLAYERDVAESKAKQWEGIHAANATVRVDEAKISEAAAKARKEEAEASKKEMDYLWGILGVCGTIMTGALTFAITIYKAKNK